MLTTEVVEVVAVPLLGQTTGRAQPQLHYMSANMKPMQFLELVILSALMWPRYISWIQKHLPIRVGILFCA